MNKLDLQTPIDTAYAHVKKINELVTIDFEHEQETLMYWSVALACIVETGVKKTSKQTMRIILKGLLEVVAHDELKNHIH